MNKRKIINDPVYGFISIPFDSVFDVIEHPYFQRLRRIQQLGLTSLVYPGALHTRFHHALGAMHLMTQALDVLIEKGVDISSEECEAVTLAILLHDIGHGPFSHALEKTLIRDVSHEVLSRIIMEQLNAELGGALNMAIQIFTNNYPKHFLHGLVSSQLDMDRMDYLNRDSFFTGVHEGVIGYDRIIKMLNVKEGSLVVESKGIYSIEKFLIARRLMYWQVYLHKTVISAEQLLIIILNRAKELFRQGHALPANDPLQYFLNNTVTLEEFENKNFVLDLYVKLDDFDVLGAIKQWVFSDDDILADLSRRLIDRRLFKSRLSNHPFEPSELNTIKAQVADCLNLSDKALPYYFIQDSTSNFAYYKNNESIKILHKDGRLEDIVHVSDNLHIEALSNPVVKYFICYPEC